MLLGAFGWFCVVLNHFEPFWVVLEGFQNFAFWADFGPIFHKGEGVGEIKIYETIKNPHETIKKDGLQVWSP